MLTKTRTECRELIIGDRQATLFAILLMNASEIKLKDLWRAVLSEQSDIGEWVVARFLFWVKVGVEHIK